MHLNGVFFGGVEGKNIMIYRTNKAQLSPDMANSTAFGKEPTIVPRSAKDGYTTVEF